MRDPSRVRVTGPLERYAGGFRVELDRRGYAPASAAQRMQLMACVSRWMAAERVAVSGLTWERLEGFVGWRRAAGYAHFTSSGSLAPLLDYLRARGAAPELVLVPPPDGPVDVLMERYRTYLLGERGLAAGTVRYYLRFARLFLEANSAAAGEVDPVRLTAGDVGRFVREQAASRRVGSTKNMVMALRSLFRFWHLEGVTADDLAGAVPGVAPQSRSLPRALPASMVRRLLASCDRRTAVGRRNFAVLIVLSRLGLRAGEAAAIELEDIDWRRGELLVRGKGGRREILPLPVDVGEALAGYLQRGRPRIACGRLFLRVNAPSGALSPAGVSNVVRSACRRCGLPVVCAHRLRHTAATETLRAGASLEEIGQLLRQQSTFTTAIYARVDRDNLRELALPWPGGAP
jgi:integrase/recombinase XerD